MAGKGRGRGWEGGSQASGAAHMRCKYLGGHYNEISIFQQPCEYNSALGFVSFAHVCNSYEHIQCYSKRRAPLSCLEQHPPC